MNKNNMNRQIKFRVWDNKKKIWLDKTDFCIYNGDAQEVEIGGTEYLYNGSSYNPLKFVENDIGGLYCNRNLIIQQYTGLIDKYDNPIYEGDIVEWDNLNYLVEWNDIAYKWQGRCPYYHSYHHPTTEHFRDLMNGVIVGNYFENPELLK